VLYSWNAPELAQKPDEQVRLAEQENSAGNGPIQDPIAGGSRVCLDEDRHADRPEKQRYLQSKSVAPADEVDNRQQE
jgi:hypothetical protein